jgi:DnaJ-class molecular chaperone
MEPDVEDAFERLRRQVRLIAQLAGLKQCGRCEGSGEGERRAYGGGWEKCDCFFCGGAGFIKEQADG